MKEQKYYNEDIVTQTISGKDLALRPYNEKNDREIFIKMFTTDKDIKWFYPYPIKKKELRTFLMLKLFFINAYIKI